MRIWFNVKYYPCHLLTAFGTRRRNSKNRSYIRAAIWYGSVVFERRYRFFPHYFIKALLLRRQFRHTEIVRGKGASKFDRMIWRSLKEPLL